MTLPRRTLRGFILRAAVVLSAGLLTAVVSSHRAHAFPHVVEPNETLARIAERFYGRVQLERVLVAANHLDRTGARSLTPGQRIEIPAVTYHRVGPDETWESLSRSWLGHERRAILLAESNGQKPWIQPELGQVITLPYNLSWVATGEESLATLAYRFLGGTGRAWALTQYNDLEKRQIERGEVLLLPLTDLPLTAEGKRAARRAAEELDEQTKGDVLQQQTASRSGVTELASDVRTGRYVSAVARGSQLLVDGELSAPLEAHVHRLLLESYVALDAQGSARAACSAFRKLENDFEFDPVRTSPKVIGICGKKPVTPTPSPSNGAPTGAK